MASTLSTREQFLLYLRDEDMRGALLRFLTKRFTDQLLLFWEEVQRYRALAQILDDEKEHRAELTSKCEEIYNTYIKIGSSLQINISEERRMRIEKDLSAPHANIFDEAENVSVDLMNGNYHTEFKTSPEYQECVAAKASAAAAAAGGGARSKSSSSFGRNSTAHGATLGSPSANSARSSSGSGSGGSGSGGSEDPKPQSKACTIL